MMRRLSSNFFNACRKQSVQKQTLSLFKQSLVSSRFGSKIPSLTSNFSFKFSSEEIPFDANNGGAQNASIVDITSVEVFQKVMKEATTPVVLDCYATWCEPCRKLTPILERKAIEAQGKWVLAKFEIDSIPQLANALKLKSVPSVILIHNGNAIDNFEGLPTDQVLQTFFATLDKLCGPVYSEQEHLENYQEALNQINYQNFSEAIKILRQLLTVENWVERNGAKTVATLALAYIKSGDKTAAIQSIQDLQSHYERDLENSEVNEIVKLVEAEFQQKGSQESKIEEMRAQLEQDPANNELRLQIAQFAIDGGVYDQAIENLLDIMKIDRNFQNRVANKLLIDLFNKLGATNPLVISGRKKMHLILH